MRLESSVRPDFLFPYFKSLSSFPGIGPKRAQLLQSKIGSVPLDVLFHFPKNIEERRWCESFSSCEPGALSTVYVEVVALESKRKTTTVYVMDGYETLAVVYFNSSLTFLKRLYPVGQKRLISGKIDVFNGYKQMVHPDFVGALKEKDKWVGAFPIYSRVGAFGQFRFRALIKNILALAPPLPEWIPASFLKEKGWPSFKEALIQVHAPKSLEDLSPNNPARERLAFDELLSYQMRLQEYLNASEKPRGIAHGVGNNLAKKALDLLPYQLTQGQEESLVGLQKKMHSPEQMRALLMGDVGCGKTIVAFLAALSAIENGFQVAFLAPTALLAQQHFQTLRKLCDSLNISIELLLGSTRKKEKEEVKERVKEGGVSLVIGTHALLEETVSFKSLSFVIIDEQHRFGVEQRKKLMDSGDAPDVLYLSATPIPRTLAMTLYGNLEVFTLKEKPAHRQDIQTLIMSQSKLEDVYRWVHKTLESQEKVFWVCPLIDDSEVLNLTSATERFEALNERFPGCVDLLHGQKKSEEKDRVMTAFKASTDSRVLVSTTVIEVGIDVPEATVMIIENAERFGLSQLHQLRGRVGRGDKKGFCALLYKPPLSAISQERLQVLRAHLDGFLIAEEDLKLRGSGNLLGTEQSGLPTFVCAHVQAHYNLILTARESVRDGALSEEGAILLHLFGRKEMGHV